MSWFPHLKNGNNELTCRTLRTVNHTELRNTIELTNIVSGGQSLGFSVLSSFIHLCIFILLVIIGSLVYARYCTKC